MSDYPESWKEWDATGCDLLQQHWFEVMEVYMRPINTDWAKTLLAGLLEIPLDHARSMVAQLFRHKMLVLDYHYRYKLVSKLPPEHPLPFKL